VQAQGPTPIAIESVQDRPAGALGRNRRVDTGGRTGYITRADVEHEGVVL
jgi:hypothetical protein